MYVMIFEDGTIWYQPDICNDDLLAYNNGLLRILDISDSSSPKEWQYDKQWAAIPTRQEAIGDA